jgi:hypothetical protein
MTTTYNEIKAPDWSPWGMPDQIEQPFAGVWSISTPSHGGFYVSAERRAAIPAAWLRSSFAGNGLKGWFEEDVDWCIVALAFPDEWKQWRGEERGEVELTAAQKAFDYWKAPKAV